MTPRTPQCEVFFPLLSSSKHSGVPEDSKSPLFQVLGFTPHLTKLGLRQLGRDSTKQKLIKTWLSSLQNPPQILLIQEHHMDEQGATNSMKGMEFWQGAAF